MKLDRLPRHPLPPAPVTPVHPHVFEVHGQRIEDAYAWLKAENWKEVLKDPTQLSPEIRGVLESENAYTQTALAGTEADEARRRLALSARRGGTLFPCPAG